MGTKEADAIVCPPKESCQEMLNPIAPGFPSQLAGSDGDRFHSSSIIDLNSFFASVGAAAFHPDTAIARYAVVPTHADTTLLHRRQLRGQGARHQDRDPVGEAKKICPGIVLIEGNHERLR